MADLVLLLTDRAFWVTVHAVAATSALIAGAVALRTPRTAATHASCTIVMTLTLVPSLWLGRRITPAPLLVAFLALLLLGAAMSYRGIEASRHRPRPEARPGRRYLSALGFNLIGLVTGLVAVGALRLGWGGLGVTLTAAAVPLVGQPLLHRLVRAAPAPGGGSIDSCPSPRSATRTSA